VVADELTTDFNSFGGTGAIDARMVTIQPRDNLTVSGGKVNGVTIGLGSLQTLRLIGPAVSFTGDFIAPNVTLTSVGTITDTSLSGTVRVKTFNGQARNSITGATVDAETVRLFLFGASKDGTLRQTSATTAFFNEALTLDLSRTTSLELRVTGDTTLNGDFSVPGINLLGLQADGDARINGNVTVKNLTISSGTGVVAIGGTVTARGITFNATTSIAASGVIDAQSVQLNLTGSPATLTQVGSIATFTSQPAGFPATTLQFDVNGTNKLTELVLAAAPLTIGSDFSLTAPGAGLAFRKDTITALGNLSVAGPLRLGLDDPANLTAAGDVSANFIFPQLQGGPTPINLTAASVTAGNGIRFGGLPDTFRDDSPRPGASLVLNITGPGPLLFDTGGINGATFNGGGRVDAGVDPTPGTTPDPRDAGNFTATAEGDITVNAPITATTGRNVDSIKTGGAGGTVDLTSNTGTIAVSSTIEVSSNDPAQRRKSAKGGNIRLTSKKLTGVAIQHTGELKALLDAAAPGPGGTITFTSEGGDILVNGGKITADRGTIDIRNNGPTGLVSLSGATLAADIVKIGALGNDGILRIGGGSISADTTMKLYAGGSNGTVDFVDNVRLGGNSAKSIAARTVNIHNGKVVTVEGPAARVFTTNANYTGSGGNGSRTGSFSGSGASTSAFEHPDKPPF
jgi:hypothetical protein